jgi:glycosyltransferase involved in cell wall biosynthesis
MNSPLVSVVIPTYNYGRYIGQAIDSALAQTYRPCEIIVVDDGSTDNTSEVLSGYGNKIRAFTQPNGGPASARNRGIQCVQGEFIAFLDADDFWLPHKLERQLDVLRAFSGTAMISTEMVAITNESGMAVDPVKGGTPISSTSIIRLRDLLEYAPMIPSSVLIPKEYFRVLGFFDESLQGAEDMEMWWRVACHYPIVRVDERLTGYRVHSGSISHNPESMLRNHLRFLDKAFTKLPQLRGKRYWRRLAEARMYREVAYMRHVKGERLAAAAAIVHSVASWPLALRDSTGRKRRWQRAKQLVRYTLFPSGLASRKTTLNLTT